MGNKASKSQRAAPPAAGGAVQSPRREGRKAHRPSCTSDLHQKYDVNPKELGHGHYGIVRKAVNRLDQTECAVKSIRKAIPGVKGGQRLETLMREIHIMQSLDDHPNIIKLLDVFETDSTVHIVTELCEGGELFDRILERGHYSELDAKQAMVSLIEVREFKVADLPSHLFCRESATATRTVCATET